MYHNHQIHANHKFGRNVRLALLKCSCLPFSTSQPFHLTFPPNPNKQTKATIKSVDPCKQGPRETRERPPTSALHPKYYRVCGLWQTGRHTDLITDRPDKLTKAIPIQYERQARGNYACDAKIRLHTFTRLRIHVRRYLIDWGIDFTCWPQLCLL